MINKSVKFFSSGSSFKRAPVHFNAWFKSNYNTMGIIDKVEMLESVCESTANWENDDDK